MTDAKSLHAMRAHLIQVREQASHNYDAADDHDVAALDAQIADLTAPSAEEILVAAEIVEADIAAEPATKRGRPAKRSAAA